MQFDGSLLRIIFFAKNIRFLCLLFPVIIFSQIHLKEGTVISVAENTVFYIAENPETNSSQITDSDRIIYISRGTVISGKLYGKSVELPPISKNEKKKEIRIAGKTTASKYSIEKKEIVKKSEKKSEEKYRNAQNPHSFLSSSTTRAAAITRLASSKNKFSNSEYIQLKKRFIPFKLYKRGQTFYNNKLEFYSCMPLSQVLLGPPIL